ncbi:hypothetical protein ACFC26_14985 [Kitasatospora purpeofusca]|uniref:hypothetical protein n=1 Tax=Kitasatospora purpeofusca TaxID=67352 RepID=UPI0035D5F84A
MTITHDAELSTYVASVPERHAAQQLEQAGFVRHLADGVYRLRRDTPLSVGDRMIRDVTRLLHMQGYGLLRLYSEDEQRRQADSSAEVPQGEHRTPQTTAPGTIRDQHVSTDVATGRLVLLARFAGAYGESELLGTYPDTGRAATFYTEAGSGWWGVSQHPDLGSAAAAFGRPLFLPASGSSRAAAARAATRNSHQLHPGVPVAAPARAVSVSAPGLAF